MARFQTYLADLLSIPESEYARIRWSALSQATGVTVNTLKAWYDAKAGSEVYLTGFSSDVAAKIMKYFGLSKLSQLIEVVFEDAPCS